MKYSNITYPDINNGIGCRVTLWIPGCTHNCKGCHNQWMQSYEKGGVFNGVAKSALFGWLRKSYITGLTLSGGDPLDQSEETLNELLGLVKEIKEKFPDKTIWVYTGYTYEQLKGTQLEILKYCDVLVDGPYVESLKDQSLAFKGSSNQRIINLCEKI